MCIVVQRRKGFYGEFSAPWNIKGESLAILRTALYKNLMFLPAVQKFRKLQQRRRSPCSRPLQRRSEAKSFSHSLCSFLFLFLSVLTSSFAWRNVLHQTLGRLEQHLFHLKQDHEFRKQNHTCLIYFAYFFFINLNRNTTFDNKFGILIILLFLFS